MFPSKKLQASPSAQSDRGRGRRRRKETAEADRGRGRGGEPCLACQEEEERKRFGIGWCDDVGGSSLACGPSIS